MIDALNGIEEKAHKQFHEELMELATQSVEALHLMTALVKLRNLDETRRYVVTYHMLYTSLASSAMMQLVVHITKAREYLRLPRALNDLVGLLWWCIEDDGYLRLLRIELVDDYREACPAYKGDNKTYVLYMLTENERLVPEDIEHELDINQNRFIRPKLVNVQMNAFNDLEQFTEFISLLNNLDNWESEYDLYPDKVDKLMFSPEAEPVVVFEASDIKPKTKGASK